MKWKWLIPKKSTLQESLLQICEGRTDEVALILKARIIFARDIRAVEAKYYGRCYETIKVSLKLGETGKNPGYLICFMKRILLFMFLVKN